MGGENHRGGKLGTAAVKREKRAWLGGEKEKKRERWKARRPRGPVTVVTRLVPHAKPGKEKKKGIEARSAAGSPWGVVFNEKGFVQ